ncbi:MAG: sigma-54 dependent transcriptional regulator [Eubacterium sp.]|nr:sigma-54 dependent transcriptional regulator [Eubacterium sp.]
MNNKSNYNILIVDDEKEYSKVVSIILSDAGYSTAICSNGEDALEYIKKNDISLLITDIRMPKMSGEELIVKVNELGQEIDILVVTAYASIENAVDAIKNGAIDYFVKSSNPNELLIKVDRICEMHRIRKKDEIIVKNQNVADVFMESKNEEYRSILDICRRTADTNISVLLLGESGVGKEVVANYIHRISKRANEPFIAVNCQEYPDGIVESELFGHEKGAFTGAINTRVGKFEEANFGTLFLDEIGDVPISTQGKLLRILETKTVERIGSNKKMELDVRFIFATNRDLLNECEAGGFREDLLYRINALTLTIPALRERKEDLPDLIDFFIKKISIDQKKKNLEIDERVIECLLEYDYPGNIRELKNIIERMIALSRDGKVTFDDALLPFVKQSKYKKDKMLQDVDFKIAREQFEKEYIENLLLNNGGNVTQTAEKMNISARQLWNKISKYNIKHKW